MFSRLLKFARPVASKTSGPGKKTLGNVGAYYLATSFVFVNIYMFANRSRIDKNLVSSTLSDSDQIIKVLDSYSGAGRPDVKEKIVNTVSEKQSIIVFGPTLYGKTEFFKYLASVHPIAYLPIQDNLTDTFNVWELKEKLKESQFDQFMFSVESMCTKVQDSILVIDNFEKLSDTDRKRFINFIDRWTRKKTMKIIIVTNTEEVVHYVQQISKLDLVILPELEPVEFIEALKAGGVGRALAEEICEKCGVDFEYAKEVVECGDCDLVLRRKKEAIWELLRKASDKEVEGIRKALSSVNESRPFGDVFKGTTGGRFLMRAGACKSFVGNVKFRNKFVLDVFKEFVNEKNKGSGISN